MEVGNRVQYIGKEDEVVGLRKGARGTVVAAKNDAVLVEFDEAFNCGHTGYDHDVSGPETKDGHGYFFFSDGDREYNHDVCEDLADIEVL